jgi:hypothetical protein
LQKPRKVLLFHVGVPVTRPTLDCCACVFAGDFELGAPHRDIAQGMTEIAETAGMTEADAVKVWATIVFPRLSPPSFVMVSVCSAACCEDEWFSEQVEGAATTRHQGITFQPSTEADCWSGSLFVWGSSRRTLRRHCVTCCVTATACEHPNESITWWTPSYCQFAEGPLFCWLAMYSTWAMHEARTTAFIHQAIA